MASLISHVAKIILINQDLFIDQQVSLCNLTRSTLEIPIKSPETECGFFYTARQKSLHQVNSYNKVRDAILVLRGRRLVNKGECQQEKEGRSGIKFSFIVSHWIIVYFVSFKVTGRKKIETRSVIIKKILSYQDRTRVQKRKTVEVRSSIF